ncbi:NAD(P)-dependent glycerol-1-phosphate dehydrogenase [Thermogladius sp. KZ2Tp1]|uniref:NAD(P)-dependent glycerol-1-phosphate dehydrogenase n=1 Tax=Thermogladius sp. KZ2Tp1 TaxID=3136289 RepID=UPI003DA8AA1C
MSIHEIKLPFIVVVGSRVLGKTAGVLEALGGRPGDLVGIVTGRSTFEIAGREVAENLKASGFRVRVFEAGEASVGEAERIAEQARGENVGFVLGVGGGRSIDLAKFAAGRAGARMVSAPTAPSHDGIASPFASLRGLERPTSVYATTPSAIIADTGVISRAPRRLILAGVGDLLGKFTAVKDWRLAHRLKGEYYGEYAAQLALMSAKHVLRYHELIASGSEEGVRILVEALISSGVAMCIAGSSRPASGSEHLFSHALDLLAPGRALHGEQVALGTILMLYLYGDKKWRLVRDVMRKIGLPTRADEIGVPAETIVKALTIAHKIRPERYTILGENGLAWEAAWRLVKETGVA